MKRINFFLLSFSLISIILFCDRGIAREQQKSRIISLTPASTEILFELGLKDSIIGVSSYCNWPPEAREKEKVGSFSSPNIEKIISLQPDLVIITGMEQEYIKNILLRCGIEYISVDPSNINELLISIRDIGNITGREKEAGASIAKIKDTIERLGSKIRKINGEDRARVYLEIWHDPIMSAGEGSFVDDMIKTAGGINITGDLKRSFSKIDPEQVIYRDPDVIILTYMKPGRWLKEERIGWESLSAVLNNRVFSDIDPDIILRPGPRIEEGLTELYSRFYEK